MRILTASVEFTPQQPSPLAEAFTQLAGAMKREQADVTLLAPYYGGSTAGGVRLARRLRPLTVSWQGEQLELPLWEGQLPGGLRIFLVEHESFSRPAIYGDEHGDWPDNPQRFGLFCAAVAAAAQSGGLRSDVVHLHDWPTGLTPYYLKHTGHPRPQAVFSLYNLAYQGHYPAAVCESLGIPAADFNPDDLEFFGHLNFLKAGLRHADAIVAMGRAHAREIVSPEGGHGMDGLLRYRGAALSAIPLGIDCAVFDPQRDPHLAQTYGAETIGGKRVCKRELLDEVGLPGRSEQPLVGFAPPLARLLDPASLLGALEQLLASGIQVIIQPGTEDAQLPEELLERFPDGYGVLPAGDAGAYHRLLAGADLLVVPNSFAPGANPQREALRYGTLPVVLGSGVLERSRDDAPLGFEFGERQAAALVGAVRRAGELFQHQKGWRLAMLDGMSLDFSWQACARDYLRLFATLSKSPA